jgi:hypothetical protein
MLMAKGFWGEDNHMTASASASASQDISALKHGGRRLSLSVPCLVISGSSSQIGQGSGLRRCSSAGILSEQVRYGILEYIYICSD